MDRRHAESRSRGMNAPGRFVFPVLLALSSIYFAFLIHEVLLPFILAASLAYLLNPIIQFFVVHGVRRAPVVIGLFVFSVAAMLILVYAGTALLNREAADAAANMPHYIERGQVFFDKLRHFGNAGGESSPMLSLISKHADFVGEILERAKSMPSAILQHMPSMASHVLPALELVFLVPFIAFFIMMEGAKVMDFIFQWVPARYVEMFLNVVVEIDNSLGRYLRALSLEALSAGLCAFAGFYLMGLDYAFQISLIMGIGGLIPYFGPVFGVLAGGAVALFQWGTPIGILKVLVVCVGVRFIEDWILQPIIMKRAVHLHPVLIIFSLMAGTTLWGFWGLLFGVPVACMVRVTLPVLTSWYRSEYGLSVSADPVEVSQVPVI